VSDNTFDPLWEEYWGYLEPQIRLVYREMRNLFRLDPDRIFDDHYFRGRRALDPSQTGKKEVSKLSADVDQTLPFRHPLIRQPFPDTFRGALLSAAGIKPSEINSLQKSDLSRPVSDINDRDLTSGPFRLAITDDPRRHLRFDDTNVDPTITILDTQTVCILALLDLTGMME